MVKEVEQKIIKHGMKQPMSENMRYEFIQGVLLEHCECGMPKESLQYIQKLLNLLNDYQTQDFEVFNRFFHYDDGLKYTVYYMLHKYGLTEHSDVVPGKITKKGYDLLENLNELYPINSISKNYKV